MAFVHGSKATITINSVAMTGYIDEIDFDGNTDTAETTVLGLTAKTYVPGLDDGTFKCTGKFDPTADAALVAMNQVVVPIVYGPQGSTTGLPKYSCNAILTKYSLKTPVNAAGTYEADFQITAGWTRSVF